MDERVKFIARLLDGERMSARCEEFSISRKTGYKILQRYRDCGVEGLTDRSRRPYRHAKEISKWCETRLASYKRPKSFSFIADADMPRTATGKILHRVLKRPLGAGRPGAFLSSHRPLHCA